jgi:hypothetical protein
MTVKCNLKDPKSDRSRLISKAKNRDDILALPQLYSAQERPHLCCLFPESLKQVTHWADNFDKLQQLHGVKIDLIRR